MRTYCFNPLHCGAVVASGAPGGGGARKGVSIPFIAGQWSLPAPQRLNRDRRQMFQSPSLRGSGRFPPNGGWGTPGVTRFNPLHCGAVVASNPDPTPLDEAAFLFQSPSLRGSGRFRMTAEEGHHGRRRMFQSPSLRGSGRFKFMRVLPALRKYGFQSPSLRGSGRFPKSARATQSAAPGFNPLHCGAVVASRAPSARMAGPG